MTNKQFIFSLTVGAVLIALGAVILTQASTGIGLVGLGFAISALALFSKIPMQAIAVSLPSMTQARKQNTPAAISESH